MITTEELASIRAAAIGDMLGDSKALDKLGPAATVFRLCRELELARKHAVTMSEVAAAAWEGEIPSPLPGHTHMTEEEFTERYNCPWCGGSGHIDDCDEADKQVKSQLERMEREADVLSIWLANAYIDIDLLPEIDPGAMNPPLPEDVRESAREEARKDELQNERNAARVWELARLLAITGGCEGCNLRGLHSCQNLVSRQLCWIKKADEIIKRRKTVEEGR